MQSEWPKPASKWRAGSPSPADSRWTNPGRAPPLRLARVSGSLDLTALQLQVVTNLLFTGLGHVNSQNRNIPGSLPPIEGQREINRFAVLFAYQNATLLEIVLCLWLKNPNVVRCFRRRVLIVEFDLVRSEEHTSELQSLRHLVCRLL